MYIGREGQEEIEVLFNCVLFVVVDKKYQLFVFNDFVFQKLRKVDCYVFICNEFEKLDVIVNVFLEVFKSVYGGRFGSRGSL